MLLAQGTIVFHLAGNQQSAIDFNFIHASFINAQLGLWAVAKSEHFAIKGVVTHNGACLWTGERQVNKPVSSQVNVVESKSLFHEPSKFGLDTFSGSLVLEVL